MVAWSGTSRVCRCVSPLSFPHRLDQILQLLFSEDIGSLVVNLKKVKVQDYHSVVER